jgi:hypothetical protein
MSDGCKYRTSSWFSGELGRDHMILSRNLELCYSLLSFSEKKLPRIYTLYLLANLPTFHRFDSSTSQTIQDLRIYKRQSSYTAQLHLPAKSSNQRPTRPTC